MAEQIKIAELAIDDKALLKSLQDTKNAIKDLSAEQKHLVKSGGDTSKTFIENEAKLKTLRSEYSSQITVLQAVTKSNKDLTDALGKEVKSIADATENNKKLKEIRNQMDTSTKEGAKAVKDINEKMDKNTQLVKDNTSQLEKQKMNIGNYQSALDSLNPALGSMASGLTKGIEGIKNMITGLNAKKAAMVGSTAASTGLSGALKVLKFALIATGIGAIVVVLGSLVGMLANTQKGTDFVSKSMAGLKAALSVITDRISAVGGAFAKFFSGDFKGGYEELKGALSGIGDEIANEASEAGKLEAALQRLNDREIALITTQAKRRKEIAELKNASKDATLSVQERVDALTKAGELEKQILADELGIARERARISQAQVDQGESTRDEIRANQELQAQVSDLETASLTRQKEIITERQGLINQLGATQKAAADAEAKTLEDKNAQDELAKQKALENEADFLERMKQLKDDARLRDAETEEEKAIITEELRLEKELLDLENTQYTIEKKNALKELLEQEHEDRLAEIRQIAAEAQLEKDKQTAQQTLDNLSQANDAIIQDEKRKAGAVAGVASQLAGILQGFLGDTLAAQLAAIAVDTAIKVVSVKSAAAASVARNLAQAAAALPPPFNVPLIAAAMGQNIGTLASAGAAVGQILGQGAISALGSVATGLQNKAKSGRGAQETFASGGLLSGASHANGGIKTPFGELEGGEAVINRNSTSAYMPLLSAINQAGGGRSFADGGVMGKASTPKMDLIDYNRLANAVASMPAPVVSVEEITRVNTRVISVEETSSF